jgi:hypothetical protein
MYVNIVYNMWVVAYYRYISLCNVALAYRTPKQYFMISVLIGVVLTSCNCSGKDTTMINTSHIPHLEKHSFGHYILTLLLLMHLWKIAKERAFVLFLQLLTFCRRCRTINKIIIVHKPMIFQKVTSETAEGGIRRNFCRFSFGSFE